MTSHETENNNQQHDHQAVHSHGHDEHGHHEQSFTITIKTLAGHKLSVEVIGSELVAAVAVEATIEFRANHELADDGADYALSLPRSGPGATLDPSSTLLAAGIRTHDELLLISRAPHVDG